MWRLKLGLGFWAVFTLIAASAVVVLLVVVGHDEVVLDLHHSNAVGRVVRVNTSSRGPGSALVEFFAGNTPAKAWVQLPWFGAVPEEGDQMRIEYLGSSPGTARRAGAHNAVSLAAVVGGVAVLAVTGAKLDRRRQRPKRRR